MVRIESEGTYRKELGDRFAKMAYNRAVILQSGITSILARRGDYYKQVIASSKANCVTGRGFNHADPLWMPESRWLNSPGLSLLLQASA